jgi:hypothetical protein
MAGGLMMLMPSLLMNRLLKPLLRPRRRNRLPVRVLILRSILMIIRLSLHRLLSLSLRIIASPMLIILLNKLRRSLHSAPAFPRPANQTRAAKKIRGGRMPSLFPRRMMNLL